MLLLSPLEKFGIVTIGINVKRNFHSEEKHRV